MNYNDNDVDVMGKTLFGEARGEPVDGQVAVAWVIRNRAERKNMPFFAGGWLGRPGAVTVVCRKPWQFSCWNADDPNRAVLDALQPSQYQLQREVAEAVLKDETPDPTNGADHYHTIDKPVWAGAWPPAWAKVYKEVARFGGHVFYDSRERVS